jgi:hypothetical protein
MDLKENRTVDFKKLNQTTLLVTRNKQWFASIAGDFDKPNNDGEALYNCSTAPGDCGSIVWLDSGTPIGFHVGTEGPDKGNRWLFFNKMVLEFIKAGK